MVLIVALVATLAVTPLAMALARSLDLLDHPGSLKVQTSAIPYLGGLGVAAGLGVGVAATDPRLLVPLGVALAVGVVDDARQISAIVRLLAEIVVGLAVAVVMPIRLPGLLGVAVVAVTVVVLLNGVNMIDGLDGLATGVGLVSALGFALVLDGDARTVALALGGALVGFLAFNRPPAKVYLGDGGAYLVGTALALLLGMAWSQDRPLSVSIGSLPLVALPAAELVCAVLRRIRSGEHLFAGDRGHVYDRLVGGGWSPQRAAVAYAATQVLLSAVAVGATRLAPTGAGVVVGLCAIVLLVLVGALGFLKPIYPKAAT